MALVDELDAAMQSAREDLDRLERELEALRREIACRRHVLVDALRLYRSYTGVAHPLESSVSDSTDERERPRADQVLAVMEAAGGPVTLTELVEAMPDSPDRGAISAVVHRAIGKGEVRRLRRGVYELARSYAEAS